MIEAKWQETLLQRKENVPDCKENAKERIEQKAKNAAVILLPERAEEFEKEPSRIAEEKENTETLRLRQANSPFFMPLPYFRELIFPAAEKVPLSSEKARILRFSPSIKSFSPHTVRRIVRSEKASTPSTPDKRSCSLFSNVKILCLPSCMVDCMKKAEHL